MEIAVIFFALSANLFLFGTFKREKDLAAKRLVIHSFISKAFAVICGVVTVVLTSRWLGAEIRGEISFLLSWIGAWMIVSDFVSGSSLINLSARFSAKQLWKYSVLWVVLLALLAYIFYSLVPFRQSLYSWIIPIAVLLMGIYNTQGAILIGKGLLNERNYSFASIPFLSLIGILAYALIEGVENIGVAEYFFCLLSAWLLAVLFTFFRLHIFNDDNLKIVPRREIVQSIITKGTLSQSGHLVQFLASRMSFFIMPILFGMESLGVYSNVVVLGEGVLIISASLGQILHARVIHSDNLALNIPDLKKYTRISVLLVIPLVILVLLIPESFWVWLLKKEFAGLGKMFVLFAPMVVFQSFSSILSHFYHAANRFATLIVANTFGLIFGFAGFMILSQILGLDGFVLGVVCGYFAQFVYLIYKIRKDFKVSLVSLLPNQDSVIEVFKLIKR
ncbi:MAG: polysaccharide biosynthesis C-terminal domain-containing protein [Bacteroidia bacterium]|nr:polysaccharide biosynthesis C-terminal domain-containing protein [Bacteroidia bacterium]MCO5254826.1 polysaccharide biosynthesis C-terminal domain-containing protein [Bacteroidota bacterium]